MNGPCIKQVVVLDSTWCSKPKCTGVRLCCDLVSKMGDFYVRFHQYLLY